MDAGISQWKVAALAVLCAWGAVGCFNIVGVEPPSPGSAPHRVGELGVVYQDGTGTHTSRGATYDFGTVFMGQTKTMKVVIRNDGVGSLSLLSLEETETIPDGIPVKIGDNIFGTGEVPIFTVPFTPSTLGLGGTVEIDVTYAPPLLDETQIEHEVKLLLTADNTADGENTATITLKARAVKGVCDLPMELDFGNVMTGDNGIQSFTLTNPTQIPSTATIGEVTSSSGDDRAFTFSVGSARGTANIDPIGTRDVILEFRPTEVNKAYLASMKARAADVCPDQTIKLIGRGVDSVLSWAPALLDCGSVPVGVEQREYLTFTNAGATDAVLSNITFGNSVVEFYVVPAAAGADPSTLTVPKATKAQDGSWTSGTATLTIACKPAVLGPRAGSLTFTTSLPKQPNGQVPVKVFGGG
jgi:hypothetical protein